MKEIIATSISEYKKIVKEIEGFNIKWFRGHSSAEYSLLPSLYREQFFYSDFIGRVGSKFKSAMRPNYGIYQIMDEKIGDEVMQELYDNPNLTELERLYKNQHNGVPTRLMDFTSDELIALFFCVENTKYWKKKSNINNSVKNNVLKENEDYGAVFILDPIHINKESILQSRIISNEEEINNFYSFDTPFAITPPMIDERIKAQKGEFILFSFKLEPLDSYSVFFDKMVKILIPNEKKEKILDELVQLGITHKTIYPDFEGYSKYAKYLMRKEYLKRTSLKKNSANT